MILRQFTRKFQFFFTFCLTLVLIITIVELKGYAQTPKSTSSSDTTVIKKVIEPISITDIGSETENTLSKIRDIKQNINPSKREHEIDSLLPPAIQKINKIKKETDLEEIKEMNLKESENLKNKVSQLFTLLDNWRSTLGDKTEDIERMKEDIGDIKNEWIKTLELEREEKLPKAIIDRIKTNIKEIDDVENGLVKRKNNLLTKQDELTGALIFLDEVLNTISNSEQSFRTQIFTLDSPPLWQMFSFEKDSIDFSQQVSEIIKSHKKDHEIFFSSYEENIYYHLLLFITLLILLFYLKNNVSKWTDERKDQAIKSTLHIISKPFSATLLVMILLSQLFYPVAPSIILEYTQTLLVIPMITLIPGIIPSVKKKYFYSIGGIFILSQIGRFFSDFVILDRTFLLIHDIATITLLVFILRSRKEIKEYNPRVKWGFTFSLMKQAIILLSISFIANVLGNTILAKVLSEGTSGMIYGGVIIYTTAVVLKSLLALLFQQDGISKLNMVVNYSDEIKIRINRYVNIIAIVYWLYITLVGFAIYDPIYNWIEDLIVHEWEVGSVTISIGTFLAFFITLWISMLVSKFVRFILQDEILTHFDMPRGVPGAISLLVRLMLIIVGFILAFGAAKIDLSNLTVIFGAFGVGIGFGLQNIFNNLVSGLILAFERPMQTGDIIQIANLNLMGEVKEIGIRASTVRTFDGAEVIVPNGNLISNEMINWTLSDHRKRQEIIVGVAYGTDINKVLEILNKVVAEQDNVLKIPNPLIIFLGFGDSSLDFRVLFWTHFNKGLGTKSNVGVAIDEAFKKANIEIPFPQRDLHLRSVSDTVEILKEKKVTKPKTTRKPGTTKSSTTAKKADK